MSTDYKTADGEKYIHGKKYWMISDEDVFNMGYYDIDTSEYHFINGHLGRTGCFLTCIYPGEMYAHKKNAIQKLIDRVDVDISLLTKLKETYENERRGATRGLVQMQKGKGREGREDIKIRWEEDIYR